MLKRIIPAKRLSKEKFFLKEVLRFESDIKSFFSSRLFGFKYPKLLALTICIILAYIIFTDSFASGIISSLNGFGYISRFFAGLLFSFGFTTPFAIGLFTATKPDNIFLEALVGGLGALIADLAIYKFVKFSFANEFNRLKKTHLLSTLNHFLNKALSIKEKHYLLWAFGGFIIASPLPDEAGIILLSGLTHIKQSKLAIISYTFNTLGILLFLSL